MNPFIENVAAADIPKGFHHDAGVNSMLIQIMDPCSSWWPEPSYQFREVHQFEFLDVEDTDEGAEEFGITEQTLSTYKRNENYPKWFVLALRGLETKGV